MSWTNAYARGLLIFVYFVVATVIIPNLVIRLDSVARASSVVKDLAVLATWGTGLVAGLYLLWRFQRKGLI